MPASTQKLAAFLAHAGVASRRKAEALIAKGLVAVNGRLEQNVARRVAATDVVEYRGKTVVPSTKMVALLLNKPRGIVSTVSDPDGKPTVMKFLPREYEHMRLYPVGRLDEDSEGLIVLTNDGDLALRLTHPKYQTPKTYHVWIAGELTRTELFRLQSGIRLKDGTTAPAAVEILKTGNGEQKVEMTIHEGRHHQIRRMMNAVNHEVLRLRRVKMGPFELGDLRPGSVRKAEILTP